MVPSRTNVKLLEERSLIYKSSLILFLSGSFLEQLHNPHPSNAHFAHTINTLSTYKTLLLQIGFSLADKLNYTFSPYLVTSRSSLLSSSPFRALTSSLFSSPFHLCFFSTPHASLTQTNIHALLPWPALVDNPAPTALSHGLTQQHKQQGRRWSTK